MWFIPHLYYNMTKEYSVLVTLSLLTKTSFPHWEVIIFFQNSQWKIICRPRSGQRTPLKGQEVTIKNEDCVELVTTEDENM